MFGMSSVHLCVWLVVDMRSSLFVDSVSRRYTVFRQVYAGADLLGTETGVVLDFFLGTENFGEY